MSRPPSPRHAHERAGLVFAGLCALNGAFTPGFAKLMTTALPGLTVAAFTTLFGAVAAVLVLAAKRELGALFDLRTAPRLAAMGALGTGLAFLLYYEGAQRSTAIETALCVQIEPVYSLVLARIALGHPITGRRLVAVAAIIAGIALALEARGAAGWVGPALLLATPMAWQLSHLVALRGLPSVQPRVFAAARYVAGSACLLALWLARGGPAEIAASHSFAPQLPLLALQGVVLAYVGTLLWYETIARLDLLRATSVVVPSVPLLSLAASFLLVGETPSLRQAAGMAIAATGVLAFVRGEDASS